MKVVVLGSGPAGLMAAQAVSDAHSSAFEGNLAMRILSRKQMSSLYGAQYLHQPIPGVTPDSPTHVSYTLEGGVEAYRRKVYGQMWDGTVSPEDLAQDHEAWDIRETYKELVTRWWWLVEDMVIDPVRLHTIMSMDFDLVVNTIPLDALCYRGHTFGWTEIIAAGDAPELGIKVPYACEENSVVCNGLQSVSWYRKSRVFGHTTVEWPGTLTTVPVATAARVRKPTYHACDCWDGKMFSVGRYGSWKKGVLSHSAYYDTYRKVSTMLEGKDEATEATA